MNDNSMAIIILCSHMCGGENIRPLEPSEWTILADKLMAKKMSPGDLMTFSDDDFKSLLEYDKDEIQRIKRLIDRSGSIAFEIEKYMNMGIGIVTRADKKYPKALKEKLWKNCPPLFYFIGDLDTANKKCVGFVGSRSVAECDCEFAENAVSKINSHEYSVVSGGAKGIDTVASQMSISNGNLSIEYISDSLIRKTRQKDVISAVRNKQLLILSAAKPDAGFNVGSAMARNKYIYAHSETTIVVKSDYKKGGTWNGAVNGIKSNICPVLCWNNSGYKGNTELIKMGAIPIDESWDGNIQNYKDNRDKKTNESEQLTFFD